MKGKLFRNAIIKLIGAASAMVLGGTILASAAPPQTVYNSPYVSWSPDGQAWTLCRGDRNTKHYAFGTTVYTGLSSSLPQPGTGEHYYRTARYGEVPVGRWVVEHPPAQCIHILSWAKPGDIWHGMDASTPICLRYYHSGWIGYCADCGSPVTALVYGTKEAIETIDYVPMDVDHFYQCPFCNHLEMGVTFNHECNAISKNMYRVIYKGNFPGGASLSSGYMARSLHMYDNATEYNGKPVTAQTRLSANKYACIGWRFVGWNTKPDGTGESYGDMAQVLNLTSENWEGQPSESAPGTVILYAQWEQTLSTLAVDPAGGAYEGKSEPTEVSKSYGQTYAPDEGKLTAPAGYTASFNPNGGADVADITDTLSFTGWQLLAPFHGLFDGSSYRFVGDEGCRDVIRAGWKHDAITLPEVHREGYSFGGWYYDEEFQVPAGRPGAQVILDGDTVFHAQWVDLKLKSEDNYSAYPTGYAGSTGRGSGAVDLDWSMADGNQKAYMIWQSLDKESWTKVNTASDADNGVAVDVTFNKTGSAQTYTVPYTGIYDISMAGAQGGNYGSYSGGKGGSGSMRLWLSQGEVLTVHVGGQDGTFGSVGSTYGAGGGYTAVISNTRGLIGITGGGGGAGYTGNGYAGGSDAGLSGTGYSGQSGMAGGGGGYKGGLAGEHIVHHHVNSCPAAGNMDIPEGTGWKTNSNMSAWYSGPHHSEGKGSDGVGFTAIGSNAQLGFTMGSASNYYPTPYPGTLSIALSPPGHVSGGAGSADIQSYAYTIYYLYNDGHTGSQSVDICDLPYTETSSPDPNNHRMQYTRHIETERFTGNIVWAGRSAWQESSGAWRGVAAFCDFRGTVSFDIPESVKGIWISGNAKVNVDGTAPCHMYFTLLNLKYNYSYYTCGYTEGQVESSKPAYGGSSYIDPSKVFSSSLSAGTQAGNGFLTLKSVSIGYQQGNSMAGIKATDLAAPDPVAYSSVTKRPNGNSTVTVRWEQPEDHGTEYFHKVQAFFLGDTSPICTSNIVSNTLTVGVAGYHYVADGNASTEVTKAMAYTDRPCTNVPLASTGLLYLHVAPVDYAGNLGSTIHIPIRLDGEIEGVPWDVKTDQLGIRGDGNIHPAGDKVWYVKADGLTPFLLSDRAWLDGPAVKTNWVTTSSFVSDGHGTNILKKERWDSADEPAYSTEGEPALVRYPLYSMEFGEGGREALTEQWMTMPESYNGQTVFVYPQAGAVYLGPDGAEEYGSDESLDRGNGLTLIGDGTGPVVHGLEGLTEGQDLVLEESMDLHITVDDALSGVQEWHVEIYNGQNVIEASYDSVDGAVDITLDRDNPMFDGDFIIKVVATDNVGNTTTESRAVTEFALMTDIDRILDPHDPIFKAGESGRLYLTTWGYCEYIELFFPEELTSRDERLVDVIVDYRELTKYRYDDIYQFQVPLYVPDGLYTVHVVAHRDGLIREDWPTFIVDHSHGHLLDEFRDRMK